MSRVIKIALVLVMVFSLVMVIHVFAQQAAAPTEPVQVTGPDSALAPNAVVTITLLHTNDFHGHLESDSSGRGGSAYMANVIDDIRTAEGEENVVLMDAGDIFFGAPPISQLLLGESSIDIYNLMGYDVAAFGNHEFDKGQTILMSRTLQSSFPWVGANIVVSGTSWTHPSWVKPYVTMTVGVTGSEVVLGVIGLDTDETPQVTIKGSTTGLEFKDLTESVLHYYDEVMAQSDALIVLAHMGTDDSGAYKGLQTVAQELIDAGKPVDLIIGGHQHQPLYAPLMVTPTAIIEAGYYGRWLGHANITIDTDAKKLTLVDYELVTINDTLTASTVISDRVAYWAGKVVTQVNKPVGSSYISLTRNYNDESLMGDLVADSMLWSADLYDDDAVNGSVDIAFTNPGGLRADIEVTGTLPYTVTWGDTFNVLPFANTLFLMDLTGAQIQTLLDQSARLYKGTLQSSGISWHWFNDDVGSQSPNPTQWGAWGVTVNGQPLEWNKVYRVVTNNFLAGGQDGWVTFAEGTDRWDTYYDMQDGLNEYITYTISPIEASDIITGRIIFAEPPTDLSTSGKTVVDANGNGWAEAGEILTFTISIINTGTEGAGFVLTDSLPISLTYVPGSLSYVFPGSDFVVTVTDNVLTAHTEGYLSPPAGGSLSAQVPFNVATITFAAQLSDPAPEGDYIFNAIELQDQNRMYVSIPPATISLKTYIFLPLVMKNS